LPSGDYLALVGGCLKKLNSFAEGDSLCPYIQPTTPSPKHLSNFSLLALCLIGLHALSTKIDAGNQCLEYKE